MVRAHRRGHRRAHWCWPRRAGTDSTCAEHAWAIGRGLSSAVRLPEPTLPTRASLHTFRQGLAPPGGLDRDSAACRASGIATGPGKRAMPGKISSLFALAAASIAASSSASISSSSSSIASAAPSPLAVSLAASVVLAPTPPPIDCPPRPCASISAASTSVRPANNTPAAA